MHRLGVLGDLGRPAGAEVSVCGAWWASWSGVPHIMAEVTHGFREPWWVGWLGLKWLLAEEAYGTALRRCPRRLLTESAVDTSQGGLGTLWRLVCG